MSKLVVQIADAPAELQVAIQRYFPQAEWDNAANVAYLESGFNAFALNDSTSASAPCGAILDSRDGVSIGAERSVGYFQINSCNFPNWEWQRLYNADHNTGTAHMLWGYRGWEPWFYSAKTLGLI
jgi:hypothetical protein